MELNHLRYFREVARTENISKAAKMLYITQPAMSVTIKKLEAELGYALFVRRGNNIKLTEAGRCFLSYVNSVFSLLEEGEQKARQIANQADNVLRVASGFGVVRVMTRDYAARYPELNVQVKSMPTDEIVDRLASGRADVGFVLGEPNDIRLTSRVIMRGRFYIAVNHAHPLAQYEHEGVHMADLEGQLLFCSNIAKTHELVSGIMEKAGVTCNLLTLDESEVLFSAAEKGLGGVFCMPMISINRVTQHPGGELVFIPIVDCTEVGKVVMITTKESYRTDEQEQYLRYIERRFAENEKDLQADLATFGLQMPSEFA